MTVHELPGFAFFEMKDGASGRGASAANHLYHGAKDKAGFNIGEVRAKESRHIAVKPLRN